MRCRVPRPSLAALPAVLVLATTMPAPAAAMIAPSLAISPTSVSAGTSPALSLDLGFSPSLGDSPTTASLALPPGLLISADLNGGACLSAATPATGCELGTGTATTTLLAPAQQVSLWLVKPPSASDIAGAALVAGTSPTAPEATADIALRTTPDVGLDISFATLPPGLSSLGLTLSSVRAPTSCPLTPATVGVSATSTADSTPETASAPLAVTGCGSLPYAPKLAAKITKNSGATLTATVAASATGSATQALELDIPSSVSPDVNVALGCLFGTPCTIGTASARSPLLPSSALSDGTVQLGGSIVTPTLKVTFPPPYPIALAGTVDISRKTLTLEDIPDLPLTSLAVDLGSRSKVRLLTTTCAPGRLTVTVTPWSATPQQTISTPIALGGGCRTGTSPTLSSASLRGVVKRAAKLAFTVSKSKSGRPITRIALSPPKGLVFSSRSGIVVRGPRGLQVRFTTRISHGALTITLPSPAAKAEVIIESPAIGVSARLSKSVKSELRRKKVIALGFAVILSDSAAKTTRLTLRVAPKS